MSGVPVWHTKLKASAKALGLKRFSSPHPCRHGHIGAWIVSSGACAECSRLWSLKKDAANRAKANARVNRYRAKNAERLKQLAKTPANRAKNLKRQAEWIQKNPNKRKAIVERYERTDPERLKELRNTAARNRLRSNPMERVVRMARYVVWNSMNRKGRKKLRRTAEILGCSFEFFKEHMERQFVNGMNWDNKAAWHVDHIVPLSSADTEEEVIALNHFTNLRPVFAKANRAKSDKMTYLI